MEINNPETNDNEGRSTKSSVDYARYSGIAFQMVGIIGLFTFIGYKIDEHTASEQPLYTALLGVAGVCLALFQVVRSLNKPRS